MSSNITEFPRIVARNKTTFFKIICKENKDVTGEPN
jgi:hypothetical protein